MREAMQPDKQPDKQPDTNVIKKAAMGLFDLSLMLFGFMLAFGFIYNVLKIGGKVAHDMHSLANSVGIPLQ